MFKGNCIKIFNSTAELSWNDARIECLKEDADLIDIDPNNYYKFMVDLGSRIKIENNFYVSNIKRFSF